MRLLLTAVFGLLAIEVTCLEKKQAFVVPKTAPEAPLAIYAEGPPLPHAQWIPLLEKVSSRKTFENIPPSHLRLGGVPNLSARLRPVRQDEEFQRTDDDDNVDSNEEKTNATKIVLNLASGDPPQNFTKETTSATPKSPESLKQESSTADSSQEVSKDSTLQRNPEISLIRNDTAESVNQTQNNVLKPSDDDSVNKDAEDLLAVLGKTLDVLSELAEDEEALEKTQNITLSIVDGTVNASNVVESKIAGEDNKLQTVQSQVTELPTINTIQETVQELFKIYSNPGYSNPGSYPVSVPQSHPAYVPQQYNYPTYRSSNTKPAVLLRNGRALELEMGEFGGRDGGKGATGQISRNSCLPVGDNSTTPQILVCLSDAPRNSDLLENELKELRVQNVVKDYCLGQS